MNHSPHAQYSFPAPIIASMSHQYAARPAPARVSSSSTTEFKGSTNPDEDWTKISDLAERRRIQNRIAQRNYRKKLKRRLEDLERRAASRSLSPNGEDTDGRSTRESSAEASVVSPPMSSEPFTADPTRENYFPPHDVPYTTSSAYSSHYRSASAPASSFTSTPGPYYPATPPTTASELPALSDYPPTSSSYVYSYSQPTLSSVVEATCGSSPTPSSAGSEHSYLPLPSAQLSSSTRYMNGGGDYPTSSSSPSKPTLYDENSMPPFYLSYAGLAESPDPSYFQSQYYHDDHHHSSHSPPTAHHHHHSHHTPQPVHIKQEH